MYADALGFFTPPPKAAPNLQLGTNIQLIHLTSVPAWLRTCAEIDGEHFRFVDAFESNDGCIGVFDADVLLKDSADTKGIFGIQRPPDDLTKVECYGLAICGIKFITLAYDVVSPFGGGFMTPGIGLTKLGREAIGWFDETKMILDLSHASNRSAEEALEEIRHRKPARPRVCVTHTGCQSVYQREGAERNASDEVMRGVADLGGIVGIFTLTFALHPSDNSLAPFVDHLRHAINVAGEDAVCIGSDGAYMTQDLTVWQQNTAAMIARLDPEGKSGARWPDQPLELNAPNRMEILTRELEKHFPSSVMEKIVGKNFFKFLCRVL